MNTFQATPSMKPLTALKNLWRRKTDFSGRSRRSEFWWNILFLNISVCLGYILLGVIYLLVYENGLNTLGRIILYIPLITYLYFYAGMAIRRLHDRGRKGWWAMAPIAASFLTVFCIFLFSALMDAFDNGEFGMSLDEFTVLYSTRAGLIVIGIVILSVISLILSFITLFFYLQDSQKERNRFGESPKYIAQS